MRAVRYSINVTLDECCDRRIMLADRVHAAEFKIPQCILLSRLTTVK